ncbi:hypothetical protein ACOSQ2_008646 [Xanthoceras sorbifolium]
MEKLADDELSLILKFIDDKNHRKSFALVSKQWLRVEGLARRSIRVLDPDSLQNFLPRFPNLLFFMSPRLLSDAHLEFVAKTCPKLEILCLNLKQTHENFDESGFADVGDDGILAIAGGCPKLSKVSLRRRKNVGNFGVTSIIDKSGQNLTYLDVGRCTLIDDRALDAMGRLSSIVVLNLDGCSLITDRGLAFLAEGSCSKSLKKLSVAECDRITDSGVRHLQQMPCLEELSLAECGPKVTDIGGIAVASIKTLKILDLSWLINVSDNTVTAIAQHCKDLEAIDFTGCELITGIGLRGFGNHKHLESLVLAYIYNISATDLDVLLQCQSLSYIVLDKRLRRWMPRAVVDNFDMISRLHWR